MSRRDAYTELAWRYIRAIINERDRARAWAVELEQRLAATETPAVAAAFDATLYPEEPT